MTDQNEENVTKLGTIDPSSPDAQTSEKATPASIPSEEPEGMVSSPQPAVISPEPGPDNLPPANSAIAKQMAELGLAIVNAERDGQNLYLIVEGDAVEDVQGPEARRLAYDARFHYGFDNSGIEPYGGAEPHNKTRYRQAWKLTRGI